MSTPQKKQASLLAFFGSRGSSSSSPSSDAAPSSSSTTSSASSPAKRKLPSSFSSGELSSPSTAEPPKKQTRPTELQPQVKHLIAGLHEPAWRRVLANEFTEGYFVQLAKFLEQERQTKTIYPPPEHVFSQLNLCPFDEVKVVILGQDPYHGPGQAHGLAFSVALGVTPPPSLKNIFKELENDPEVDFTKPDHGNLEKWARQGVLLLNAVLTVEARKPNSHKDKGWERFTDAIIKAVNDKREGVVFMLWGKYAQDKGKIISKRKHHVLTSAHPSPFAAHNFFGNKHFSTANNLLKQRTLTGESKKPIEWQLDPKDVERENQRRWLEEREAEWTHEEQEEEEKGSSDHDQPSPAPQEEDDEKDSGEEEEDEAA
ncbi:uracilDNA glycosylase [Acanthamoeba castellanii str. Neff]|uniref:Uracil-DNA glycosylase n=1 Tax=Acanthamoeba castellanii (strain ATCC 30010 / Neff) TaxID=1257118 RepID=L8HA23_ACACF|nr:uracilDNA glycosylase [Acanthamoeba castellanii str. Neff]ELR21558.1 uracilDNA glycosylase [Acanthamoeba castellanii str. Neff]